MCILSVFGITIPAFRIAGGVLLFFIAFEMIFERRQDRKEKSAEMAQADRIRNIAIFPLAIPLIAGPGAISATILLSGTYGDVLGRVLLILIVAINLAACWLVFLAADRIDHLLGATGRIVLTRLLGLILAALAVQFVADGVLAFAREAARRSPDGAKRNPGSRRSRPRPGFRSASSGLRLSPLVQLIGERQRDAVAKLLSRQWLLHVEHDAAIALEAELVAIELAKPSRPDWCGR